MFSSPQSLRAGLILAAVQIVFVASLQPAAAAVRLSTDETADAGIEYFETHIRPLLVQRCYSCHSERAGKKEGELLLDRQSERLLGGARGAAVIAGDADQSPLIQAVRYSDPDLQMPPIGKLPAESIAHLEAWIRMGAPAPADDQPVAADNSSDPAAGKTHWAFQPLVTQLPPVAGDDQWSKSDIDRFVLARMKAEGLSPVADAQPAHLIRRICLQITGLPPTAAQLAAYAQDPTPRVLEQLVDELLSSPQFGQRWGRHWLDLARYADSNGLDENFLFREAWRYRNWVIDALNADMPFDQFIVEQLAGDLLPFNSIEQRDRQRIAAGFLVVGPKVLLGVKPQKQTMDVADEQIETIGRAVLGQTLGCARCHDHKFDPIPTADYYALAGIFTSTQVMHQRYMLGQQRVMERLAGLGAEGDTLNAAYEKFWREFPELKKSGTAAKAVLDLLTSADEQAIKRKLRADPAAFAEQAKDTELALDVRIAAQEALVKELVEQAAKPPAIPPRAMIPSDVDKPVDESIRLAGNFDQHGDKIPRGFLQVLCDETPSSMPDEQSGRLELARWLTNPQNRAGWLTARVQANRIWHHLIGRGIVRTVDNFGRTGEPPTHPELLDHLALELIDKQWSVKSLIRTIVLSRTFALSSNFDASNDARDPDNRFVWRAHRRRRDPESLRDAMLTAAGTLDLQPVDSTVSYLGDQATAVGGNKVRRRTDFNCRSVYLPVIRNDLPELFDVFDFANPQTTTGARPITTVPTQALFLLNDEMVMATAELTAKRVLEETVSQPPDAAIERLFELVIADFPTDSEREAVRSYLTETESRLHAAGDPDARQKALTLACHALFASSRFQFPD